MTDEPAVIHETRRAWPKEEVALFGEDALRQTLSDELIRNSLCGLGSAGAIKVVIEPAIWGVITGRAKARCTDPLCVDLLAAHPGNSSREDGS